ncbi:N-acetylglutamate kinase [Flavobacterium swingsii]|uniref:Acetylglutamate kinase n=1 Tax=Flavobacterium swingsii TaxID=498292 RepID=A0A1I0XAG5_9FLAO|nr:acetylglutamate kinase [Flavobacterium swingsii]SFA96923.1 N-acetylglutamate kinase [Flavobacterium swingsii]
MKSLQIIKIGGNVVDDAVLLDQFLYDFVQIKTPKILIHGGGKIATELAQKLNVVQTMIEGRRVTDSETLKIATMVYAGLVNKNIVAKLQSNQCNAIGLSGADANVISGKKRNHPTIDFGFVGDIVSININQIISFINQGLTPVFCPIIHDSEGTLLNTNADTIATQIAIELAKTYQVNLSFCFEKKGVLRNPNDDESYIPVINRPEYERLKASKIISNGMIPKLDNAFDAINNGVHKVLLYHANQVATLETNLIGTQLQN